MVAIAYMTASTSSGACPVARRTSSLLSTASYSRDNAVEQSSVTVPIAACRSNSLLAPEALPEGGDHYVGVNRESH